MHKDWQVLLLPFGYLMLTPMTLLGFVFAWIYDARSFRIQNGIITCVAPLRDDGTSRIWGKPGAQTWGCLIIFASEDHRDDTSLQCHEVIHVWQGMLFSLLYTLTYSIDFLARYAWVRARLMRKQYRTKHNALDGTTLGIQTTALWAGAKAVRVIERDQLGWVSIVVLGGNLKKIKRELDNVRPVGAIYQLRRPWWESYRWILWERHAFKVQAKHKRGELPKAWLL